MTARRVVALLHRCGRGNDPALVEQILSALKTPALRQPAPVEKALGQTVTGLLTIIRRPPSLSTAGWLSEMLRLVSCPFTLGVPTQVFVAARHELEPVGEGLCAGSPNMEQLT